MKHIICLGATALPLLAGCASKPLSLSPVGPGPVSHTAYGAQGYLQVFSDTETRVVGDGPPYYIHTGYSIHDESGKIIKFVENHIGDMDESPSIVSIPAGKYNIVAQSSSYGRVAIPVLIREGQTTCIHLDRSWKPSSNSSTNELVYLPDGEAIGWSGSIAKSSE
ncbi:MAG TPA: hypothetical protein VHG89_09905 [Verrucomicrobiae bacterium]|nr:hypothetical protein [Verrucomicrobiae bacterium]